MPASPCLRRATAALPARSGALHRRALLLLLAVGLALAAVAPAGAIGSQLPAAGSVEPGVDDVAPRISPAAEVAFAELINRERAQRGLAPLRVHVEPLRTARAWSLTMAETGVLAHNPDVGSQVRLGWSSLAENVGVTSEPGDDLERAARLHRGFMDSPLHRANLLNPAFDHLTIGVVAAGRHLWTTHLFMTSPPPPAVDAIEAGLLASRATFASGRAEHVVVSRGDVFADSLAGSGLLVGGAAPILFTDAPTGTEARMALRPDVRLEIDRVLGGPGLVYLLGGAAAVSAEVEHELRAAGHRVQRLAGSDRIATGLAVADEVVRRQGRPSRVVITSAADWPDAITAGAAAAAAGHPVLLTAGDHLPDGVARFLASHRPAERFVAGGARVVADDVVRRAGAVRVAGPDRAATAAAVAATLLGRTEGDRGARYVTTHGWTTDGWATALAWTPYAARHGAPLLLTADAVPSGLRDYLAQLGHGEDRRGFALHTRDVGSPVRDEVNALLGG